MAASEQTCSNKVAIGNDATGRCAREISPVVRVKFRIDAARLLGVWAVLDGSIVAPGQDDPALTQRECDVILRPSVLCPIDFSGSSRGALRYAGAIAAHFAARLTLLAVNDSLLEQADELSGLGHLAEDT
jgi:hypothetical protein